MKQLLCSLLLLVSFSSAQDDRTFYKEIDKRAWPGDELSPEQVEEAVMHFRVKDACKAPWQWALIGPNVLLLKGTTYMIHRRLDAPVPNIGWSKGYWGGTPMYQPIPSVNEVKKIVERLASDDCKYERQK
jgi:hypothetical protein